MTEEEAGAAAGGPDGGAGESGGGPGPADGLSPDAAGSVGEAATGPTGAPSAAAGNPFAGLRTISVIPWMIFVTLILYAALHILSLFTPLNLGDPSQAEVAGMAAGYGALAGWLLWVCRRAGVDIRQLVGSMPEGYSWGTTLLLLAATMAFSLGSWFVFAYGLSVVSPGVLEFLVEALATPLAPSLLYQLAMPILVVVAAPLLEEVAFRGVLLNRWSHKWGVGRAVIATSFVFGFLHANPVGITAVGIVAALLYLRTRTLIVPIVFHAANNLLATIGGYAFETAEAFDVGGAFDVAAEMQEIQQSGLLGIGLVAVTLPVLIWYMRRHWPEREAELPYGSGG